VKTQLLLVLSACLSACAVSEPGGDLPDRRVVVVDGQGYDIGRLTESTWTAIARPGASAPNSGAAHRLAVLQAIERASGCRVSDSDYSLEGRQLDAQLDCASRLKN
jgi:hypothetical protein